MKTVILPFRRHSAGFVLLALCFAGGFAAQAASPPVVSNVSAAQRAGTKLVDIRYDLADPDSTNLSISILVSQDSGATFNVPANTFISPSAVGANINPGVGKTIVWNAGADWDGQYTTQCRVRVIANDANPDGFVLIPAGSFDMGDTFGEGGSTELPVHSVTISAFEIEKSLVTGARWNAVRLYALAHAYAFANAGANKATDHPVQTISWFDAVKWCNARSQMEGRTPCYYTDAGLTAVYRTGQVAPFVNSSANGYRLPTEAEWEKAARGGLSGKRFPWGDTITHNQANYISDASYAYDTSLTRGSHPTYATGGQPYTSPVGSFAPNGYGLNDMAGNVTEWCWDWYASSYYGLSPASDPVGPTSGISRVLRGGSWNDFANVARCAVRSSNTPALAFNVIGFRCVRGL